MACSVVSITAKAVDGPLGILINWRPWAARHSSESLPAMLKRQVLSSIWLSFDGQRQTSPRTGV